ncbi:MAG: HAMP domain-containing histidine kinase [Holophagaceae bacterium]|uniref:histidine kinase n=1 Tax=Candidatus Geothrix skivensis TaxID=2954439 RepID=A0A9D7SE22_9BACT|nr:HAMP domain-containing histidine kinase [Candidatus Geothrix skivensis]
MTKEAGNQLASRPGPTLALVSGGALLLGLVAQFAMSGPQQTLVILIGLVALFYLAGFAAARRARKGGPEALGWKILAASLLANSLIQASRIPAFLGQPLPALARNASILVQVLVALLLVGTLLAWSLTPRTRFDRVRHGLDGLLFALSVFFILWGLVLGPVFLNDRFPLLDRLLWVGTFLVYDLLLGLAIYFGLAEPSRFRGPLGWLSLAFLLACLHNFNWLLGVLSGTPLFQLTLGPLVYTVPLAYLAAALSPRPVDPEPSPPDQVRIIHVLPYLPVIGATTLGVWMLITGGGLSHRLSLVWISLSLVIVLLVRQYFALRDFFTLSQHLELRVAERTQALEEAQAMLLRTERMKSLATLGAGLSHDLNNVLCAIQSRAELVLMDVDEAKVPDRKDLVRMQEATQLATTMSRRLMNLGRQEEAHPQALDLAGELVAMQPLLQLLLPRNQLLELENATAVTPFLGTKGMLEQILVNLVSNARDAMPSGGRITLRIGAPGPEDGAKGPLLEVEDSGTGIPEELQGRLFEPFFTTKPVGKGTGLGLMSVKALLQKSGGQITFTSQAGRGTTFQVRLPRLP